MKYEIGLGSTLFLSLTVSVCLCLCICLFVSLRLSHYHHQMMSFKKIYGLYGLEHHTVEIDGDVTMRTDKQTNERTSEYRATQSMDSVRLSFAMRQFATQLRFLCYSCYCQNIQNIDS